VVVVVLSVVEVELSEVVNSSFSSLHEMMLRLINEMEITYIVFLIELSWDAGEFKICDKIFINYRFGLFSRDLQRCWGGPAFKV